MFDIVFSTNLRAVAHRLFIFECFKTVHHFFVSDHIRLSSLASPSLSLTPPSSLSVSTSFLPALLTLPLSYLFACPVIQEFLTKYSESNLQFSDSNINFGRHQILECARGALEKSKENTLSKDHVIGMCDSLEGILVEV